jgi:DNA-binding response OmpR family regulator
MAAPLPVLVVEDEASLLDLLVLALGELAGYAVVRAADGEEALARARERRPGVVVLDLNLPKVDGYEVARRLRADPATAHAWVIAISGLGHADAALAAGCDQFLWKPLGLDELELAVRAGLARAGDRWGAGADAEGGMALEADVAALLAGVAGTVGPLDRGEPIAALVEDAFRRGGTGSELRTIMQEALAVCSSLRDGHISDADARARLLALADRLQNASSG